MSLAVDESEVRDTAVDVGGGLRRRLIGWVGVAVAGAVAVLAYVIPSYATVSRSLQDWTMFGSDPKFVGLAWYRLMFDDPAFGSSWSNVLPVAGGAVLVGGVMAPVLAYCVHRAGGAAVVVFGGVWGVPAVVFAPTGVAAAWLAVRGDDFGSGSLPWAIGCSGVILSVGVLAWMSVFRGATRVISALVGGGISVLALIAVGLQVVALPSFDPEAAALSPVSYALIQGLYSSSAPGFGLAASSVLFMVLAMLGIGAALLFVLGRVRFEYRARSERVAERMRVPWGAISGVVSTLLLGAVLWSLWPWVTNLTGPLDGDYPDRATVVAHTWLPPLLLAVCSVAVAAVGGFAIGVLRPLGRHSRWLLLPFAPWLFVGTGPLVMTWFHETWQLDGWAALLSRAWISIPALFVFTALFWGLEDRRRMTVAAGVDRRRARLVVLSGFWPAGVLSVVLVWLAGAQDLVWQSVKYPVGDDPSGQVTLHRFAIDPSEAAAAASGAGVDAELPLGMSLGYPLPLLAVFALAVAAAGVWYLPRISVRAGG
ncbi:hypothetical protein [Glycomyces salinus]|uniref:hypothetical protein n=1 Tax=Glycomyces salinus TaxID=980294 RepID=UPI0018EE3D36|nr:hypothetical protein [Glycomyces salinus]